jgi:hypothetical protein
VIGNARAELGDKNRERAAHVNERARRASSVVNKSVAAVRRRPGAD